MHRLLRAGGSCDGFGAIHSVDGSPVNAVAAGVRCFALPGQVFARFENPSL
jgi:hypothetical protein